MRGSNLSSSFDAAVRHLSRHVHDVEVLKRNPITRPILEHLTGTSGWQAAAAAVIKSKIMEAARSCYSHYLAQHRGPPAKRLYDIVVGTCLRRQTPIQLASALGISVRQFYRDRRTIFTRIARILESEESSRDTRARLTEAGDLGLRRYSMLLELGFPDQATFGLKRVIHDASTDEIKLQALAELANAFLVLGDVASARNTVNGAQSLLESGVLADNDEIWLRLRLDLIRSKIERADGHYDTAHNVLRQVVGELGRRGTDNRALAEVALDTTIESCKQQIEGGGFELAQRDIERAERFSRRFDLSSVPREIEIQLLRACLATIGLRGGPKSSPGDGLYLYSEALRRSRAVGAVRGALNANIGLMAHFTYLQCDDQSRDNATQAIALARLYRSESILASTVLDVADAILCTKHWRMILPLLQEVKPAVRTGTLGWVYHRTFEAICLKRLGRVEAAAAALQLAESAAKGMANNRSYAATLRELGVVLNQVGQRSDAQDCLKSAVARSEQSASALALCYTYRMAEEIIGDVSYGRKAHELLIAIGRADTEAL